MTQLDLKQRLLALEPRVRALVAARLQDAATVDDVVQSTLIAALRHLPELRDPAKLLPWTLRIARNTLTTTLLDRRRRHWSQALETVEQAAPAARRRVFEEMDAVVSQLAALGGKPASLQELALHFCFDWPPGEIAAIIGIDARTVAKRLERAKRRLRQAGATPPLDPDANVALKSEIAISVYVAAAIPLYGETDRNLELMREAHQFATLVALEHPRHPNAAFQETILSFYLARQTESATLLQAIAGSEAPFGAWQRESWDGHCRLQAEKAFRRFLTLNPHPAQRAFLEGFYAVYAPPRNEDVDWRQALRHLERYLELTHRVGTPMLYAWILSRAASPLRAARFLEDCRRNPKLRNDPLYYFALGRLFFFARKWRESARNYRKFLRWLRNPKWRALVQAKITECRRAIAAAKPASSPENE